MTRFTLVHLIACSEDAFWRLYLDTDFTRRLIVEGLGFYACEVPERRGTADGICRVTVAQPKIELPDAVAKLLGPRLSYREDGVYRRSTGTWEWTTELGVLSEKIQLGGSMHTEPAGPNQCRRLANLWVRARIFGLGGLVEKAAERNLRKGWQRSADWINERLAAGDLAIPPADAADGATGGHAATGEAGGGPPA